jgi:hypothetical protein
VKQSTLTLLGLAVFGLVFLSFLIRAFGQFLVGMGTATLVAGPVAVAAAALLVVVLGGWTLSKLGIVTIEPDLE